MRFLNNFIYRDKSSYFVCCNLKNLTQGVVVDADGCVQEGFHEQTLTEDTIVIG